MDLSSPKSITDKRLLAIEELFRQKRYAVAIDELSGLKESSFDSNESELGLFYSLLAHARWRHGEYRQSLEYGLQASKLLAHTRFNARYGQIQVILCKTYMAIGDLRNAEMKGRDALAAFRRANDESGHVDSLNVLAHVAYIRGDYQGAAALLDSAAERATDEMTRAAIGSNLGQIYLRIGSLDKAEKYLCNSLDYHLNNDHTANAVSNLLSLGLLQLRSRKFILSGRKLDQALELISKLKMQREKVIYLEFSGELALEKGETYKAKSLLSQAYTQALTIAPESDKVSQSARLLADAELALDNVDEAMKYGQKALEVSVQVGEKLEAGLSKRVIAQAFAARNDFAEALEYIENAVEIVKEVGDPYETGRTLLVFADIMIKSQSPRGDKIKAAFEEARQLFGKLGIEYWIAETDYRAGVYACQSGDLASGFRQLSVAERSFAKLNDEARVRSVHKYLKALSDQAVAASLSQENEFKVFGNIISSDEISSLSRSQLEEILDVLLKRTGGDRALLYSPEFESGRVEATFALTPHQAKKFEEKFSKLLGEEFSKNKPSLLLDCRRDPFVNGLFGEDTQTVSSVIVVPVRMSDRTTSYLYLDKFSRDNGLNPFSQMELNFAVGFSDIIAFKWAEIQKNRLLEDNLRLKTQLKQSAAFPNIITQNSEMLEILSQVRQVVDSNISISIEGETGSGKDVLVRAIHYNSSRRDKRFISVNCAALPETLLESELFGYRRGAFTGADRDKAGLFEEADGGTFFLDEIGDMPLGIQAKVLRVLEEKELVRLGETTPRQVDVRIVSATNRDLKELMSSGGFRQDLYYRLSALTFRLPPLRERKEDIPLLVGHFLEGTGKQPSPELLKALVNYDWPGNVRELENEIKKLVLLAGDSKVITPGTACGKFGSSAVPRFEKAQQVENTDDIVFDETYTLYDYLAYHEKRFIIKALKEKKGVKKHAAELLNIPESTLRLKIKQYDINLKNIR